MTIGDIKKAWKDLDNSTEVYITDPRKNEMEYRSVDALEIETTFEDDTAIECFNIRLEE